MSHTLPHKQQPQGLPSLAPFTVQVNCAVFLTLDRLSVAAVLVAQFI